MSERDVVWQERRLEEILFSNTDPVSKVQQIIRLGFDPEVADEIVERHQASAPKRPCITSAWISPSWMTSPHSTTSSTSA
jgi:hypothetical protein